MGIKHIFTSAKADDPDATLINPSNWNDDHEGSEVLDRNASTSDVANTTSETTVYTFTIPAGVLGVDGGFEAILGGDMLVNVAGTLTLRIKLGATTVFVSNAFDPINNPNRFKWLLEIFCLNVSAASQKWVCRFSAREGANNLSIDNTDAAGGVGGEGYNTSAENTAGALALVVTAQWSVASASLSFRKEMAKLTRTPPV